MNVASFLEEFSRWARAQANIEAVALVGSYARDAATTESDVDLMILTTKISSYFQDQIWVSQFGEVEESKAENWGGVETLRVFYKGAIEVEYNFSSPNWASIPVDAGTHSVISDGMKILSDPQGILERLQQEMNISQV
jgi:uncharacterized protein